MEITQECHVWEEEEADRAGTKVNMQHSRKWTLRVPLQIDYKHQKSVQGINAGKMKCKPVESIYTKITASL